MIFKPQLPQVSNQTSAIEFLTLTSSMPALTNRESNILRRKLTKVMSSTFASEQQSSMIQTDVDTCVSPPNFYFLPRLNEDNDCILQSDETTKAGNSQLLLVSRSIFATQDHLHD